MPADKKVTVKVTANLNDTVQFLGEVKLFIENNPMTIISVQAVGIGTTIVSNELTSPLNFKPHFR